MVSLVVVLVRKVYVRGKSLTFTIPEWLYVPELMYVYADRLYLIYSPVKGLEADFDVRVLGEVRRGTLKYVTKSGAVKKLYVLTIPSRAGILVKERSSVIVTDAEIYQTRSYIVFTNMKAIEEFVRSSVLTSQER